MSSRLVHSYSVRYLRSPSRAAWVRASIMNALVGGSAKRSIPTSAAERRRHARSRKRAHFRSQLRIPPRFCSGSFNGSRGDDDDVLDGGILVALAPAGLDGGDLVHRIHPFGDSAEDSVTVVARAVVEETV